MDPSRHRLRAFALLFGLCLIAPACGRRQYSLRDAAQTPYKYVVGTGDVLAITVWREPELQQRNVLVTPDGQITVQFAGTVRVVGLTLEETAGELRKRFAATLRDPQVSVALVESRAAQVHVLGEVKSQQPVAYRDGLTLMSAISSVGGPIWQYAKVESVWILRGPANPEMKRLEVDFEDVIDGDAPDPVLEPGDVVVVPAKWVTKFDRYTSQLFAPLRIGAQSAADAAGAGVRVGTSTLALP